MPVHDWTRVVEIVPAANKDRKDHLNEPLNKLEDALSHGIHVLVVDLFPPGKRDPLGLHGVLWNRLGVVTGQTFVIDGGATA